jgi:hypothetical protein
LRAARIGAPGEATQKGKTWIARLRRSQLLRGKPWQTPLVTDYFAV